MSATVIEACLTPGGDSITFWCDYCRDRHYHGTAGTEYGDEFPYDAGHRVSHCSMPFSPYRRGGYELRITGRLELMGSDRRPPCCPSPIDPRRMIRHIKAQEAQERRQRIAAACWN